MPVVNREAVADLDAWVARVGSSNFGNGKGNRLQIGGALITGVQWQNRVLVRIPIADIMPTRQLSTAVLDFLILGTQQCFAQGSGPKIVIEELDVPDEADPFDENGLAALCEVSGAGGADAHYPGPAVFAANRVIYQGSPTAGSTISVSILAMAEAARIAGKTHLAFRIAACDADGVLEETNGNRRLAIASRESGTPIKLRISFEDNNPPNAPTGLTPVAGTIVNTDTGAKVTISGAFSDPDPGNYLKSTQVEIYAAGVLQAQIDAGTAFPIQTVTQTPGGQPQHFGVTVTGLAQRTDLQYRVRNRDQSDAWGAWSELIAFRTNALPAAPANPVVTQGTTAPNFLGSIVSADAGEYGTAAEVEVYEDPAAGDTLTKWASGKQTIGGAWTRFSLAYGTGGAHTPLEFGKEYRGRMRVWDRDDQVGPWTAFFYFTPTNIVGPTGMSPIDVSTKQASATPPLTIADAVNFDRWELEVYDNEDGLGTALWDVPLQTIASTNTTTKNYGNNVGLSGATVAVALQPGQTVWWRSRIRTTGNPDVGLWSPLYPFYINATPNQPAPISVVGGFQRDDGSWVVDDTTPTLVFPFRDPDIERGYVDGPTWRQIELHVYPSWVAVGASPYEISVGITDQFTVPAGLMAYGDTFVAYARYHDNTGPGGTYALSPFSEYLIFKASQPPNLAVGGPEPGTSQNDPTLHIVWSSDQAQSKRRAVLTDITGGMREERHDSGEIASPLTEYVLPAFQADGVTPLTQDGHEYEIEITSWSADGLPTTLTWTYFADYVVPAAPTGLVLTAVPDAGAIDLTWDPSPDDLFVQWVIEASGLLSVEYRRVDDGTLFDPDVTTFRVYDLPNNRPAHVRVRQHNGALVSLPAEAAITVPLYDLQFVVPGDARYTFALSLLEGFPKTYPASTDNLVAFGRRNAIASKGTALGASGTLAALVPAEEWWKIERLREMQSLADPIILKDGYGSVVKSSLGDLTVTPGENAMQHVSMNYQQVED